MGGGLEFLSMLCTLFAFLVLIPCFVLFVFYVFFVATVASAGSYLAPSVRTPGGPGRGGQ
jgi:hypothetical protein